MIGQLMLNLLFVIGQSITLVFSIIALFTNIWIKDIETQHDDDRYFERVASMDEQTMIFDSSSDRLNSAGLWRLWTTGSISYPLPIVDTEVKMALGSFATQLVLGSFCLYVVSFQLFGLFTKILPLEMIIGWLTFFQTILAFAATGAAMSYYKETFAYQSAGFSMFAGWISGIFCLLLVVLSIFRVRVAMEAYNQEKEQQQRTNAPTYEKLTLRSTSESRLYNPGPNTTNSRPNTAERNAGTYVRPDSRGGGPADYPPRRESYDSKQYDMHNNGHREFRQSPTGVDYGFYDQNDMPRHIKLSSNLRGVELG